MSCYCSCCCNFVFVFVVVVAVVLVVYVTVSPFHMIAVSLSTVKFVYPNIAICVILTPFKNSFSGSEWDYVILSLVRSLSKDEIDPQPSIHWLREHLGFLTDEHQINVGLTRARKGLCIIGMYDPKVLYC